MGGLPLWKEFQNRNPADTREVVAEYTLSFKEDAQDAIQSASKAFPGWAATTPVGRGRILSKVSQILDSRKAELSELLTREEGKTLTESTGEVQRAIDIFRFSAGLVTPSGARHCHTMLQTIFSSRRDSRSESWD